MGMPWAYPGAAVLGSEQRAAGTEPGTGAESWDPPASWLQWLGAEVQVEVLSVHGTPRVLFHGRLNVPWERREGDSWSGMIEGQTRFLKPGMRASKPQGRWPLPCSPAQPLALLWKHPHMASLLSPQPPTQFHQGGWGHLPG